MRLDNSDNNTRSGASSSSPPLHAEVRAAVDTLIYQAIALSNDGYPGSIADRLRPDFLQAVADALLAALPEKILPDAPALGYKVYPEGYKRLMEWRKGRNDALDVVTLVIGELRGWSDD